MLPLFTIILPYLPQVIPVLYCMAIRKVIELHFKDWRIQSVAPNIMLVYMKSLIICVLTDKISAKHSCLPGVLDSVDEGS